MNKTVCDTFLYHTFQVNYLQLFHRYQTIIRLWFLLYCNIVFHCIWRIKFNIYTTNEFDDDFLLVEKNCKKGHRQRGQKLSHRVKKTLLKVVDICGILHILKKLNITVPHWLHMQADKTKSRGYMFVEYESHKAAALARRKLSQGIDYWSRVHERAISLSFLGIIMRFLRLEVFIYNNYITNHLQTTFAQGVGGIARRKTLKTLSQVCPRIRPLQEKTRTTVTLAGCSVRVQYSKNQHKLERKLAYFTRPV
jgi:hypothetical protein